jgi:DUF4097 and DUF4098 domain-containing protein YvlB
MASPTQIPPYQVPPPRYRRSLSGPIVLIGIGVLFLMGTLGMLDWHRLGHWFAHYWPVLLILSGLIKLIEYQQAQRHGTRAAGIGAGGVVLILALIFFGLIATQASRFNWEGLRDQIDIDDGDFGFFGQAYDYQDQLQQDFPAGASLQVDDIHGAVNITPSDDTQIHVSVHKKIHTNDHSDADKWNQGTRPKIEVNGNIVSLHANNQGAGDHSVTTDLDVSVPRKAAVNVSTRFGDVRVTDRDGDVTVSNRKGEVMVANVNGKVSLTLTDASGRVSQIASDVSVEGRGDDVSLDDIKGTARVDGEFDSLKLARIAKGVNFKSERTDLGFSRLDGDLDMDSGDLSANDLFGPLRLNTRSKDIRLNGVSGEVHMENANGSIELHMNQLGGMQLENRKGDIQVYLPDKAGFQVDARSRGGEVETDFNSLKVSNGDDLATASGSVGSGGPHLVINNEHGTIELRKGSSVAEAPPMPEAPPSAKAPRARPGAKPAAAPAVTEN